MKITRRRIPLYKIVRNDGKVIGHSQPDYIHEFISQDLIKVIKKGANRDWSRSVIKAMNQSHIDDWELYPDDNFEIPTYRAIKTKRFITKVTLTKRN